MARANPVSEERPSPYERDFYLWIEQQTSRLREGRLDELDVANLLEEIEDMGRSEKRAIERNLVVLLSHLRSTGFNPTSDRVFGAAPLSSIAVDYVSC